MMENAIDVTYQEITDSDERAKEINSLYQQTEAITVTMLAEVGRRLISVKESSFFSFFIEEKKCHH